MSTHEEAGQECIESESMLPDGPCVCTDCGHLIEGLATCDNCGKVEHTPEELRACLDSMLAPVADYETEVGRWPEQRSLAEQRSTERAMRRRHRGRPGRCPDCGQVLTPMHRMDTGDAPEPPPGACPVLFELRNRKDP